MSNSAFPDLTEAQKIFKEFVWDPLIMAGESALFVSVPALDWPIIGTIDREIISVISNWLFSKFALLIDLGAIKFVDKAHQAAFDHAASKLLVVAHDLGVDSPEFQKAKDDEKAAFLQFIRPSIG